MQTVLSYHLILIEATGLFLINYMVTLWQPLPSGASRGDDCQTHGVC